MPLQFLLHAVWDWIASSGITIAILIVAALLVPRAGRLANRILERRITEQGDEDEGKGQLALGGVGVYIVQLIAYFIIVVFILREFGFSLAGAAIPATVVSAAIGFGAQSIIADFLSGFFIISEKQYGVGDWVAFVGNGVEVEGTVIQFTMRSTQIRTIEQSTVNIPNSTARVAINRSNYWSRAVVVIPVPLLGSRSSDEALKRAEAATRRALEQSEIQDEVLGQLEVHPAVAINPPSVVGMPWTVDMRFMVQVKAGSQWLVERAVRMSILNEFWNEYASAPTVSGELIEDVYTADLQALNEDPAEASTALFSTTRARTDMPPTAAIGRGETEALDGTELLDGAAATPVPTKAATDSTEPTVPAEFDAGDGEDPAAKDKQRDADAEDNDKRAGGFLTFGGTMRRSTAGLLALFGLLLILRGLTFSATVDEERVAGVLAPPPLTEQVGREEDSDGETNTPVSTTPLATSHPTSPAEEAELDTTLPPAQDPPQEPWAPPANPGTQTPSDVGGEAVPPAPPIPAPNPAPAPQPEVPLTNSPAPAQTPAAPTTQEPLPSVPSPVDTPVSEEQAVR